MNYVSTDFYQLLHADDPLTTELLTPPSQVWIIATLEIPICVDGVTYLVLQLSSYSLKGNRNVPTHGEGYWAPPFIAYPVELKFSPPTTLGSLLRIVKASQKKLTVARDIEQLAYGLGLRDVVLDRQSMFVETKVSPRSPDLVKAFIFERFTLKSVSSECFSNISDSQGLFGFSYLDISSGLENSISTRYSESHRREEIWHLGKPLQSNLEHVVFNNRNLLKLISSATPIEVEEFYLNECGLIVSCDLSGFGSAVLASRKLEGYFGTGDEVATDVMRRVSVALNTFVRSLGTLQVQIAGDGAVFAIPDRSGETLARRISNILEKWSTLLKSLKILNSDLAAADQPLGSRIALHYGGYQFGRVTGPLSVTIGFGGEAITQAVRFEQGLKKFVSSIENEDRGTNIGIVSEKLIEQCGDLEMNDMIFNFRTDRLSSVESKEFKGLGQIIEFE